MRGKQKPNTIFESGPQWNWDPNLKHWFCLASFGSIQESTKGGFKVFVWEDIVESTEPKSIWSGYCADIPGVPEPGSQRTVLDWFREQIALSVQKKLNPGLVMECSENIGYAAALDLYKGIYNDVQLIIVCIKNVIYNAKWANLPIAQDVKRLTSALKSGIDEDITNAEEILIQSARQIVPKNVDGRIQTRANRKARRRDK